MKNIQMEVLKTAMGSRFTEDTFLTGSRFIGNTNDMGMQDYGTYIYPDGTRYSGSFRNDRFHGKGTIQMPDPSGVTFSVVHRNGRLIQIEEINFNDSLPVDFKLNKNSMSFEKWNYCTKGDRRFHKETLKPMEAVGPKKFKTKDGPEAPILENNVFDMGFGHLNQRGFIMATKSTSNQLITMGNSTSFYLGCRETRRWIRENCAHGTLWNRHLKQSIKARFAREIMQNNLTNSGSSKLNKMPGARICRRSTSLDSLDSDPAKAARLHAASSSVSCSSDIQSMRDIKLCCGQVQVHKEPFRRSQSESSVCRIN